MLEMDSITKESLEELNHTLERVHSLAKDKVASQEAELKIQFAEANRDLNMEFHNNVTDMKKEWSIMKKWQQ